MRNEFGGLPRKNEVVTGLGVPTSHRLRRWRAVKYPVELGCVELACIILQLVFQPEPVREKRAAPGRIMPSGSANPNPARFACPRRSARPASPCRGQSGE